MQTQQRKAQAIRDTAQRLTTAIEACQNRLNEELIQSATQLNSFRAVLGEISTIVGSTNGSLEDETWGKFKTHDSYCHAMVDRITKLSLDLTQCADICNCFQADVPKSDINRIVGEIGKLSLIKRQHGADKFTTKRDAIAKSVKDLLKMELVEQHIHRSDSPSASDSSLEGSGSVSENDTGANKSNGSNKNKVQSSKNKDNKAKKILNNSKPSSANKTNRNNSAVSYFTKPADSNQYRTKVEAISCISATPKKRNSQGAQSTAQKKQELFKFKGMSQGPKTPFVHQPGLLGPRPNLLQPQGLNQQFPFSFSNMNSSAHQRSAQPQFGVLRNMNSAPAGSQSGFGSAGFNFSNSQPRPRSMEMGGGGVHNQSMGSMNYNVPQNQGSRQARQSGLFQMQQNPNQNKAVKGPEQHFGGQSRQGGVSFPFHQSGVGSGMMQPAQGNLMNAYPGISQGNMEQQLNEISQKIQHMQLAASQNYQLQQLMRETERLKQMVAQKQHQQHDRFQHQFQLLINAFMQQQQQQMAQGPQSKMAKSVLYQNSQRRLTNNRQHQLQYQKKQKQQQNKVQQVRLEQDNPQKKLKPDTPPNTSSQNVFSFGPLMLPRIDSTITKQTTFDPHAQGDKRKTGVSAMVVLDNIGCLVIVDILNSCLKLYEISLGNSSSDVFKHSFVTRLELNRLYYMCKLSADTIVVSRDSNKLSLVRVSKKRLEFLRDIDTESQYFGVAYVKENLIACCAYTDNRIDLVTIQDSKVQTSLLVSQRRGPELIASLSKSGSILYLERVPNVAMRLVCLSLEGKEEFAVDLESTSTDVWNVAAIEDRIICSNKQTNTVCLFSDNGSLISNLVFPSGSVNCPFAMAFCNNGNLYIANDSDWDSEFDHYVTTEVNIFKFS